MKSGIIKKFKPAVKEMTGFTLIELMIAVSILMISLILTLTLMDEGVGKLQDMRVSSQVKECGRLVMEYYGSMPPDTIYGMSSGSAQTNDFMSGSGGDENLNSFVAASYPICRELSDPGNPLGSKVQLKYIVCPGCQAYEDVATAPGYISCIYFYKVQLRFNSLRYGGANRTVDYMNKVWTGQTGDCDDGINPNGCGSGSIPDVLRNCNI